MNDLRTIDDNQISDALTAGQALRGFYTRQKALQPKFSVAYLASKSGLSSKGLVSDLMAGRRKMNPELAKNFAKALKLEPLEKKFFILLAQSEAEKSVHRLQIFSKRVESMRSQLKSGLRDLPAEVTAPLLFSRVYCAIGLFASAPTIDMIADVLKDQPFDKIQEVVSQLEVNNAIRIENGLLYALNSRVIFGAGSPTENNLAYLSESIEFAKQQALVKFAHPDESFIQSTILSVKKKKFIEALPKLREFFESLQVEVETASDGDALAYFNIQVF